MRKPFIAGNWKMNKTPREAADLAKELMVLVSDVDNVDIMVAPTALCITSVAEVLKGGNVRLGAQNMFWEASGAYTGEWSADMLVDSGCTDVIIGHSERRQYFGETNETVGKRLKAALAAGLKPIMCVGELLADREAGKTEAVVEDHVKGGLEGLSKDDMKNVTIAYEPVWAIGTGETATPEQAQDVHAFIRGIVSRLFGEDVSNALRIQYGGSVKPSNAAELLGKPDIDGALVGGAALKADSFAGIIKAGA